MSNSLSAHDIAAGDDDDGYGEIGVYARRTGTDTAAGKICMRSACCMLLNFVYVMFVKYNGHVMFFK